MLGRILVAIGGIVVIALFAALLAPLFIDWSGFRQQFEDQASRILGKKVTVYGAVEARFLPFPSITMHDVRVGQEADGTPQVLVREFSMDAELAPFLSGEALIFDMRIVEPVARVRLLSDGTLDWMRGSKPAIPADKVVLEKVSVSGGEIDFIDEQSGRSRKVTDLQAAISAKSLAGPWKIEGSAALDGESGHFTLASTAPDMRQEGLHLQARILPDRFSVGTELEGILRLVDNKPVYSGNFSALFRQEQATNAAPPSQRLKGSFELTNEKIRVPGYQLEIGDVADPYIITGEATLDTGKVPQFLLTANGQQIDINKLNYQGENGKTTRDPKVSAATRLNALIAAASAIPVPQVPGKATIRLPAIVSNDTALRDLAMDVRPNGRGWLVDRAIAMLPGRTQVEANGDLLLGDRPQFRGHLLVASAQPSGLSTWIAGKVAPSIRLLKSAGFSADVDLTREVQDFRNLELILGDANLKGTLQRQDTGKQAPALSVDLSGNALDYDVLAGLAQMFSADGTDGLAAHQIAAKLKLGKFHGFGVDIGQLETVFSYSGDTLSFERFVAGDLAGASVTGIGRLENSAKGLAGTARIGLSTPDPTGLFTLMRQKLPAHPLIDRLVANAQFYEDLELKGTVAFGGEQGAGLTVKASGTANGSNIAADFALADLAHAGDLTGLSVALAIDSPSVTVLAGQAGFQPLPIDNAEKSLFNLQISGKGGAKADLAAHFAAGKTVIDAKGEGQLAAANFLSGTYDLAVASDDLEPYFLLGGVSLPGLGTGLPFEAKAALVVDPDTVALKSFSGVADGTNFTGALSFDRQASGLKANGALTAANLDLAWLAENIYGPLHDEMGALSMANLPKAIDNGLDLTLDLSSGFLWTHLGGPVRDFKGKLHWAKGQMDVTDVTGVWSGGAVSGHASFGNAEGSGYVQTALTLSNGNTAALSWMEGNKPVVVGRFDGHLSLEAAGKSPVALVQALSGSGAIVLRDTTVSTLNLDLLTAATAAADATRGEIQSDVIVPVVEETLASGPLSLPQTEIPFTVANGRALVQNVTTTVGTATMKLSAATDLANQTMTSELAVQLDPGAEKFAGADPGLSLGFSGPVDKPQRRLDITPLTNYLSLRAFEHERVRVERLQAKVLEKQRLRREALLYQTRATARLKEAQALEEQRMRDFAAARLKAMAEAAAKAAADQQQAVPVPPAPIPLSPAQPVPPTQPKADTGLPGVTVPDLQPAQ